MNLQLQGRDCVISDMYSSVKAFKTKLTLWEAQMREENLSHFPSCQTMKEKLSTSVFPSAQFADKIICSPLTSDADLLTLKHKKAYLNCSVIHLLLT